MSLMDNDRIQEIFLVLGDYFSQVSKKWLYAMGIAVVALIPFYYLAKYVFVQLAMRQYHPAQIVYTEAVKSPLQIIDKKIFSFPGTASGTSNAYSGYIRIKNINLEWGVANQEYTAEFKTLGGTTLTKVNGSTFILPASEKLIVFSRFTADEKPEDLQVTLSPTNFVRKPEISPNLEPERINLSHAPDGLVVSAGIKNLMAFTVKTISLPVVVYNNKNEIVAVNYTYINDVLSGETRTFQYTWPADVKDAVRAEITPEINIFDRNVFSSPAGVSPFNAAAQPGPAN